MSKLRNDATSALCVLLSLLAPEECAQLKMYDWVRDSGRIALPGIISVIHPARTTTYTARERERTMRAPLASNFTPINHRLTTPHNERRSEYATRGLCDQKWANASQLHNTEWATEICAAFYADTRSGRPQNASTIGHLSIFALSNFAGERMNLRL